MPSPGLLPHRQTASEPVAMVPASSQPTAAHRETLAVPARMTERKLPPLIVIRAEQNSGFRVSTPKPGTVIGVCDFSSGVFFKLLALDRRKKGLCL